jgi:sialidase-1
VQARPPGAVRVLLSASDTDGLSWSPTLDVTARVADEKNDLYVISGPGVGIQDAAGRLLIPLGIGPEASAQATVAISEDHGKNWQRGGRAQSTSTETQIVELADGTLRLDMRNQRDAEQPAHCRYFALSRDGGRTWTPPRKDPGLICVRCQGSILRYTGGPGAKIPNRLLSAAPSSTYRNRVNMTVRLSYDEGQTWPVAKTIHPGPCAYSCLAILPDGSIGLLYEGGGKGRYDEIRFARFTLNWLTAGADRGDTTE